MLCPKCGTENTDQAECCVNCDERLLTEEDTVAQDNVDTDATKPSGKEIVEEEPTTEVKKQPRQHQRITDIDLQADSEKEKPVVSSGFNIAIIIGTVFLPIIGVIVGFTYMRKDHPEAKKAGKTWLMLGAIMIVLNIIMLNLM